MDSDGKPLGAARLTTERSQRIKETETNFRLPPNEMNVVEPFVFKTTKLYHIGVLRGGLYT